MKTSRMEAFSDGVIAIVITIMVLEIKVPHGTELAHLAPLVPVFLSYVLSFIYIGIYWNNHHHLLYHTETINGCVMWANLHLLFWLSLVPFATGWMGENHFAPITVALYGFSLLLPAVAYHILARLLISHRENSGLKHALARDRKRVISIAAYALAAPLAFVSQWISLALYVVVAIMWFTPEPSIEQAIEEEGE